MKIDHGQVDENRDSALRELRINEQAALENFASGEHLRTIVSVNMAAECSLVLAMLDFAWYQRSDSSKKWVLDSMQVIEVYLQRSLDSYRLACVASNDSWKRKPLGAADVWYPFVLSILANDIGRARELARWSEMSPPFVVEGASISSCLAQIFFATLTTNQTMFRTAFEAIQESAVRPTLLFRISEMAEMVFSRNEAKFQEVVDTAEVAYRKRNRLRMRGQVATNLGIDGYGPLYFDYATLVLVKIANHLGMGISIPKTIVLPEIFL